MEQEARPWALSPITEVRSRAPSPHTEARSWTPSLATEAEAAAIEDEALSTYTPVKPSGMDWTIGKPLFKLEGKLKMNPFSALMDINPTRL